MNKTKTMIDAAKQEFLQSWKTANAVAAAFFTLMTLVLLPVVFHDYYFDILKTKYYFYCVTTIAMVVTFLGIAIAFWIKDRTLFRGEVVKSLFKNFSLKKLTIPDWAMLAFFVAVAISTFQSEYFYESFWGNEGRLMGMFMMTLFTVSFFLISKSLKLKRWYLDAFLAGGMIVCLLGILHYFKLDPLGFKAELTPRDYLDFTSTIGNINTYTSYLALVAGVSAVLFAAEKHPLRKAWYTVCVTLSLFALITGISDNAYLTMATLFGLLPLYLFNNRKGVKNYVVLLAILATEFLVIGFCMDTIPDHVIAIKGLFNYIADFKWLPAVVAFLWGLAVLLWGLELNARKRAGSTGKEENNNIGRWIWLTFLIVIFLCVVYVLYDVNVSGNVDKYSALKEYLLFDDDWGTHRGYIWKLSLKIYEKFPFIHKLFGYGPDTFGIITVENFFDEMVSRYNEKFDSVHNEYLQYLITIGILGLITYLGLLLTSIIAMVKKGLKSSNPALVAIVMAVICYCAQAMVNISVPIVAPVMMTLLMVGVAGCREEGQGEAK